MTVRLLSLCRITLSTARVNMARCLGRFFTARSSPLARYFLSGCIEGVLEYGDPSAVARGERDGFFLLPEGDLAHGGHGPRRRGSHDEPGALRLQHFRRIQIS